MARPTKAKEAKPKAEGQASTPSEGGGLGGLKGIIINSVITILIASIFLGANYLIISSYIRTTIIPKGEGGTEETEKDKNQSLEAQTTFPYDLDDFIINLNSPTEKRYLKVKVSLDIERHEDEPAIGVVAAGEGKEGGHGGAAASPKEHYNTIMEPYKMPIRDVIITKLSSMSAEELSSVPGKEQSKEAIKEEINTIMPQERQVLRVNYGDFIIQ